MKAFGVIPLEVRKEIGIFGEELHERIRIGEDLTNDWYELYLRQKMG